MIEGQNILCFAPGPWDDIWRNRHQIMVRLSRANRVLYVEPWPYLRDVVRQIRAGSLSWRGLGGPHLSQVSSNLYVYRPAKWAPREARTPIRPLTQAIQLGLLRRTLRTLGFRQPLLWLFLPDMEVYVGRFDERLVIYHMVDEYSGYDGVSEAWRPIMQDMERDLARSADLVLVSSETLWENKHSLNAKTVWIPNAVDFEAFAEASGRAIRPVDIIGLSSPIAGYVGAINEKLDLELLAYAAQECAGWTFLLVGPVALQDKSAQHALLELQRLDNVRLLGQRPVESVPAYVASCDVCLLPYKLNEWTRHIDSLKLYEYLACGKPVVSTRVPTAERFSDFVHLCDGQDAFAAAIPRAQQQDSAESRAARQAVASRNTWDQRIVAISDAIAELLAQPGGRDRCLSHQESEG
jgi:glycosyltransferase involved in cell wall biosynthesis